MELFSNSHFLEQTECSTTKLGIREVFEEYLEILRMDEVDGPKMREKLRLFKAVWEEIEVTAQNILEKSRAPTHSLIRANLNYYLNPAFLQGAIVRINSIIDYGEIIEASHYLKSIFLAIAENYVILGSSGDRNLKTDYTILIRSLKNIEESNPKTYNRIIDLLDLNKIGRAEAIETIEKARKIALKIRGKRQSLIKKT